MALEVGARLGHYTVDALIGEGGMGQVYQATDTKLNRQVALKILPEAFASDPDRLARFQREAQVLASLNHPGIAAIHGIEESDGQQALVLELVEGPTLADRIAKGPIPLDEALPIAKQIAEALEAAHEAGVIHRDLKPANIKIRDDGTVKVLDFGLAKALVGDTSDDASQSPTITAMATATGVIVGTAAYMAPEQAKGRLVDKRADIWAFGAVLFEMLTGTRVFDGQGVSETLARVIEREPDLTRIPPHCPPSIRRVIQRCLTKDPSRRLRDIGDASLDLSGEDIDQVSEVETGGPARRPSPWGAPTWAVAVVVSALAGAGLSALMQGGADEGLVTQTQILLPPTQELDTAFRASPLALSPDGRRLVYAAEDDGETQLYVRDLRTLDANPIPGTMGARQPFFSPDGESVAFFARGMLQRVALTGGSPLQICEVAGATFGGSWGGDEVIVFATTGAGLHTVAASGGAATYLAGSEGAAWPERLPDSRVVLFTGRGEVGSMSLDGGSRRVLALTTPSDDDPEVPVIGPGQLAPVRFVTPGYLLLGHGAFSIRAVAFDASSLRLTGAPVSVVDSVYRSADGGPVYFAVARNGTLVYAPEDPRRRLVWVDRSGRPTPIGSDHEAFRYPHLSPDGRYLAIDINTAERRSDVWFYDTERETRTRLTSERHSLLPVWHPTGTTVTYSHLGELVRHPAFGGGDTQVLIADETSATRSWRYATSWTPDGHSLLMTVDSAATSSYDVWVLSDTEDARPLLDGPPDEAWARFSPDGRWLTYMSDESGTGEVYVARFPEMTDQARVSTNGGNWPVWAPDGREVFYRQGNAVMAVAITTTPSLTLGSPAKLFEGAYVGVDGDRKFDVHPNGDRFLMIERVDSTTSRQLVLVQNWFEELKRLVPVD